MSESWRDALPVPNAYLAIDEVELKRPVLLSSGTQILRVPTVVVRFERWTGEPFAEDLDKGESAFVSFGGIHTFAEIAILRLLESKGWEGRWVCTYSAPAHAPRLLKDWIDAPLTHQLHVPITKSEPRRVLDCIAKQNTVKPDQVMRFGGCWDVFAWRDTEYVFLEAKRKSPSLKDELNPNQERWLSLAVSPGEPALPLSAFGIVQWDYVAG